MENGRVTFAYEDYADGNKSKVMTLEATEFTMPETAASRRSSESHRSQTA
jgi:hypothetical protein